MPARSRSSAPDTARAPSDYVEYAPSEALRPFVVCFWTREATGARAAAPGQVHRILPDGCIDIVLEFNGPADEPESAMVVGTMTKALVLDATASPECFVGVRFRPGKAAAFLNLPASEVTDLRLSLDDVWRDAPDVREAMAASSTAIARVRALERVLLSRLTAEADATGRDIDEAVRRIIDAGGSLGITRLAPSLGVTRQHLARRFSQLVGVSPKTFARIVRLSRVVERVRAVPPSESVNWSMLALELGYYDQSHLVDEFREMTGVSPAAWRESKRAAQAPDG